jgi:membrane-associated phospholipid phosphatase
LKPTRNTFTLSAALAFICLSGGLHAQEPLARSLRRQPGEWKTWIISSGAAYRVPPPPDDWETRAEAFRVKEAVAKARRNGGQQKVKHWDAGAPSYRWIEMIERRIAAGEPFTAHPHRPLAYVALAMYDATVAAWDSKAAYKRPRPSELEPAIRPLVDVPDSPSYPSEHSATAAAAAGILAYFFPAEAATWEAMAEEAGLSRVQAGVQFPSDHQAGMELGRRIAQAVIARAASDGYTVAWNGSVPSRPCAWTGANPGNAAAAGWKPMLLAWPGEFRPGPPPDCQSAEVKSDAARVREFPRTFSSSQKAFYWQGPEGRETWNFVLASKWMFEDGSYRNAPRAARVYALLAAAHYDAFIASQDAKFTYWFLRPHQLDSAISPLFPVPNFPSYPSNHSTFSWGRAEILAYLFPERAEAARVVAQEAAESRIWAGIHYALDLAAGKELGMKVSRKFIELAERDGSQ